MEMTAAELEIIHEKESLAEAISRTSELIASVKEQRYPIGLYYYEKNLAALKSRYAAMPVVAYK